ncbi:NTF2 fold immunity protein [Kordia sp. SMS9]|uniref:hypothetical protein n=1 Tax=Kordia sp. SMS9 TaxID=2282170 RepID=UPI000E0E04BF|nr:hypothetical protein [Kordia sp. SMS9]AXG69433.1 NTF2 fold immunity protein [Kordia sp. SMS9]
MGIFSKLFGKKDQNQPQQAEEIIPKLAIDVSQTPRKFQHFADEIVPFLIEKLHEIHILEKEVYTRSRALKNPKEPNQVQPGEDELWDEYAERRKAITAPISVQPTDGGGTTFGKPTKYEYLYNVDTKIVFIMKSVKRVVVELYFKKGVACKDQFVLRKEGEHWKVHTKKYGFQGEDTWYKDDF